KAPAKPAPSARCRPASTPSSMRSRVSASATSTRRARRTVYGRRSTLRGRPRPPHRSAMAADLRPLGVATAGFCAFANLYSPQALLPELANEFHVGAGDISSLMTAGTGAIALTAPFTGVLADIVGRKRLITAAMFLIVIPTVIMTFAATVPEMVFWRFVQ